MEEGSKPRANPRLGKQTGAWGGRASRPSRGARHFLRCGCSRHAKPEQIDDDSSNTPSKTFFGLGFHLIFNHMVEYCWLMTKITTPFSGGCACGEIRYECTAEPMMMLNCHCRDCQRSSGGPFSSFVVVPTAAFELRQGTPALPRFSQ